MANSTINMCEGPLFGKLIKYTIPVALSGILQLFFNAADMAVIGQFRGSISVAAVGATTALISMIVALFMSLSVGGGVLVGQAAGAAHGGSGKERLTRIVHTVITVSVAAGTVLTVLGIASSFSFLEIMKTPDEVIKLADKYMKIYFCGSMPLLVYNFGAAILMALGDSKRPLKYLSASGVINVILNIIFVVCFKMDVEGVAIATVIAQTVSAVLVIAALMRRTDECRFEISKMHIYKNEVINMIRIGFPAGIQSLTFSISNVIVQSSVNSFGSLAVSGHSAASNIDGFVYITMNAFSQSALNFTAQNFGAEKYDRIKKITYLSLASVSAAGIVTGLLAYLFAEPLLSVYITDSQQAIKYGIIRITYLCLPYFICGCMEVVSGIIRGMGTSILPMIVSIFGVCGIRIGWIYTIFRLPQYHSLESLYISYPISWAVTFAVHFTVLNILIKKYKKVLNKVNIKFQKSH